MHEDLTRIRVSHAIRLLREEGFNVDAVSRLVGYRRTKNFYRALRRLTRLTPGRLRALETGETDRLARDGASGGLGA